MRCLNMALEMLIMKADIVGENKKCWANVCRYVVWTIFNLDTIDRFTERFSYYVDKNTNNLGGILFLPKVFAYENELHINTYSDTLKLPLTCVLTLFEKPASILSMFAVLCYTAQQTHSLDKHWSFSAAYQGQQGRQGSPDVPLPNHLVQLHPKLLSVYNYSRLIWVYPWVSS